MIWKFDDDEAKFDIIVISQCNFDFCFIGNAEVNLELQEYPCNVENNEGKEGAKVNSGEECYLVKILDFRRSIVLLSFVERKCNWKKVLYD